MMRVERDIAYAPDLGDRGKLDLYLPGEPAGRPLVMVIHGGGLREFSKERMAGVSAFIAEGGWIAVNVNYRLLPDAPYPAALQDVLAAYRWLREADQADLRRQDRTRIALLGASAGAFLAMMAGLILGQEQVRCMVSISGPARPGRYAGEAAKGSFDPGLLSAPTELVGPHAPPLLAIHSRNDQLVKPQESVAMVERMQAAGCCADLYLYDGPGKLHGIWRDDRLPPRLFGHIEDTIGSFLSRTL
jgi:acetyl esterase/lipase